MSFFNAICSASVFPIEQIHDRVQQDIGPPGMDKQPNIGSDPGMTATPIQRQQRRLSIILIAAVPIAFIVLFLAMGRTQKPIFSEEQADTVNKSNGVSPLVSPPTFAVTPTRTAARPTNTNTIIPTKPPSPTTTTTFTPTPQIKPIVIEPYCSKFSEAIVYIQEHQPVILWWRWDAATPKHIQDHLGATYYEIRLDGEEIFADRVSEIEYLISDGYYRISWYADVGTLSPGSHVAERFLSWDKKISDGWDTFGPGSKNVTLRDDCKLFVR